MSWGTEPPTTINLYIDGVLYQDVDGPDGNYWVFDLIPAPKSSIVIMGCGLGATSFVLIDPDGYVFDATKGFSPENPTQHAIAGTTATCMALMPELGGWVPWPAHLYDNQQNPQVTGTDGYFAFFTPPGFYYLKIDGIPGFQSWRSPVIQVINEIVHVNVPLTPYSLQDTVYQVKVAPPASQDLPTTITVPVCTSVEGVSTLNLDTPAGALASYNENPVVQIKSTRNPLSDVLGWDSSMLVP